MTVEDDIERHLAEKRVYLLRLVEEWRAKNPDGRPRFTMRGSWDPYPEIVSQEEWDEWYEDD